MLKLYSKIDALKKELDQEPNIKKLTMLQEEILNDQKLYQMIKRYGHEKVFDEKILAYRKQENEVNFLILAINQYLKNSFHKETGCHNESN